MANLKIKSFVDFETISQWAMNVGLVLDLQKSETIVFCTKKKPEVEPMAFLEGNVCEQIDSLKFQVVSIDKGFKLEAAG